jgi:CBS domain containing-hemolysin-like protein
LDEGPSRKRPGLLDLVERVLLGRRKVTGEEIQELIDAGEQEGLLNEEENEMIRSILDLRDRVVREIMVPRMDMACIATGASVREIIDTVIACGHSRIPVYDGTLDNIIGLVYAKDLLKCWGLDDAAIDLRKIMRLPFFVPETKSFEELLQEFKRRRVHIAIVIDEYGGTSGLVTIEDVLEQIVGDIQDEYDTEEEWLTEQGDGAIVVDARLPVEEMEKHFGVEIEREKFDTVGGLIFHLTGRIPRSGEVVEGEGLVFRVLDAEERKINLVRVERKPETGEPEA